MKLMHIPIYKKLSKIIRVSSTCNSNHTNLNSCNQISYYNKISKRKTIIMIYLIKVVQTTILRKEEKKITLEIIIITIILMMLGIIMWKAMMVIAKIAMVLTTQEILIFKVVLHNIIIAHRKSMEKWIRMVAAISYLLEIPGKSVSISQRTSLNKNYLIRWRIKLLN